MKRQLGLQKWIMGLVGGLALCLAGNVAQAQSVTTEKQTVESPQPAAAPSSSTTVVQAPPAQTQAQPAPAVNSKTVVTDTHSDNFMGTIAKNTFFGAVAGTLVGGAIYFLDRDDVRPVTVGYWAAGGALVGAAVGIVEVGTRESRSERAVSHVLGGGRSNVAFVPRLVNYRF